MPTKSKISLFQLFFLSFAYVFSGLFLIRETSFLSLLVPLVPALVYCALGHCFLQASPAISEKDGWISFLSCGKPHWTGKAFAGILAFFGAAELIFSWMAFASSVQAFSDFLPFSLAAALVLLLAIFFGAHGMTALGRFAELSVFLILPLLLWLVFWDFVPINFRAVSENLYAWLAVLPSPILYMFSMTALTSTAVPKPAGKAAVPLVSFGGALTAVLCAFLFLIYGAGENNIFYLLFGWTAAITRLALLVCVCTASGSGRIARTSPAMSRIGNKR